jgi:4-hydroxybenzoate polyprenyltransferase
MSRLRTYAQLVRLPNLPTALADVCLGALAAHVTPDGWLPFRWLPFLLLLATTACLYSGGMVWNDYFDVEQDRRERPERPIPSGRVSRGEAGRLGAVLIAGGLLCAILAGMAVGRYGPDNSKLAPPVLAACLVAAIFLYDGWLKRTPVGPVAMGLCRFLNVLMAVSISGSLLGLKGVHLAFVVGLYVAGVTWFARTEARLSSQWSLGGALAVMLFALLLALPLPLDDRGDPNGTSSPLFPYLLVALGVAVALPACQAVATPTPNRVQAGVKRALMALVLLDATLATALAGTVGLVILVLMAPTLYLNRRRWLYAT